MSGKDQQARSISREEACEIFMRNMSLVRAVALRNAPTKSLVDDIVHDVFVHFVQNSSLWKYDESKVKGLFKTITMNIASRHWHVWLKNRPDTLRKLALLIREKSVQETDDRSDVDQNRLEYLEDCMSRLSGEQRKIIEACYFENTPYPQLAEKTGKSVAALYKTMSRIRAFLYDCIRKTARKEAGS